MDILLHLLILQSVLSANAFFNSAYLNDLWLSKGFLSNDKDMFLPVNIRGPGKPTDIFYRNSSGFIISNVQKIGVFHEDEMLIPYSQLYCDEPENAYAVDLNGDKLDDILCHLDDGKLRYYEFHAGKFRKAKYLFIKDVPFDCAKTSGGVTTRGDMKFGDFDGNGVNDIMCLGTEIKIYMSKRCSKHGYKRKAYDRKKRYTDGGYAGYEGAAYQDNGYGHHYDGEYGYGDMHQQKEDYQYGHGGYGKYGNMQEKKNYYNGNGNDGYGKYGSMQEKKSYYGGNGNNYGMMKKSYGYNHEDIPKEVCSQAHVVALLSTGLCETIEDMHVGDVDGDHRDDILCYNSGHLDLANANRLDVYYNTGHLDMNMFAPEPRVVLTSSEGTTFCDLQDKVILVTDVDNDGADDLICLNGDGNTGTEHPKVLCSQDGTYDITSENGQLQVGASEFCTQEASNTVKYYLGDFNGDTYVDIMCRITNKAPHETSIVYAEQLEFS